MAVSLVVAVLCANIAVVLDSTGLILLFDRHAERRSEQYHDRQNLLPSIQTSLIINENALLSKHQKLTFKKPFF